MNYINGLTGGVETILAAAILALFLAGCATPEAPAGLQFTDDGRYAPVAGLDADPGEARETELWFGVLGIVAEGLLLEYLIEP